MRMGGGKGRRRREKNWLAAHGGNTRLPPPPTPKELEAVPSKLRRMMDLRNPASNPGRSRVEKKGAGASEGVLKILLQKANSKGAHSSDDLNLRMGDNNEQTASNKHIEGKDLNANEISDGLRKGKRKSKGVQDLRFQNLDEAAVYLKKKDRRKEYLKARTKKRKTTKMDNGLSFPGREEIRFGEVVEAPPKLSFPRVKKTSLNASAERKRLEAVDSYRNRRGWADRLGIKLPTVSETMLS